MGLPQIPYFCGAKTARMKGTIKLFSTSTVHGSGYLDYAGKAVQKLFQGAEHVLFVPYARPSGISHEEYYAKAKAKFDDLGIRLLSIHHANDPKQALVKSEGIFIGGGNTFVLLRDLYQHGLLDIIKEQVETGTPYMGTSAGSNVAGLTINTTNDMPIVYPPAFEAIQLVDFNLNPHYLDPDPGSTHKGETRETRIKEFHQFNTQPVVGLREGSWLTIQENEIELEGTLPARLFFADRAPIEVHPGPITAHLLAP